MNWEKNRFRCVIKITFPCYDEDDDWIDPCSLPPDDTDDCDSVPVCKGPVNPPGAQTPCPFIDPPSNNIGDASDCGGIPEPSIGAQGPAQAPTGEQYCDVKQPGQPVCFDILSFHSEFELNAIPSAVVSVALGRRADDVTRASRIHYFLNCMKLQLPATVWCEACADADSEGESQDFNPWPTGQFKIFEGYVTGSGFRRSTQGADLSLSLTHWLADLNFSSALSRQSHPLNPAQFFFPANFGANSIANTGGGGIPLSAPFMVGIEMATPFFQVSTVMQDFWGGDPCLQYHSKWQANGLKSWLLYMSQWDRINQYEIEARGGGEGPAGIDWGQNWEACRALSRFEPNAVGPDFNEAGCGYILGVPLGFKNTTGIDTYLTISIADHIGHESLEAYSNVTLWDKLSGQFHADYMFSVVPLVEKALVVPFVPGLSTQSPTTSLVHRTLQTSDYESMDTQSMLPRPLRAVGILIGSNDQGGGSLTGDQSAQYVGFGGWFDKMTGPPAGDGDPAYRRGLIMFKGGPRWLNTIVPYDMTTESSTGLFGTIRAATDWLAGGPSSIQPPRQILQGAKPVWDLYARTVYIHEVLKLRQGTISGPVRFDIAPGSTLRVETAEDQFVKEIVQCEGPGNPCCVTNYMWCQVLRVSTTIDSQNMRAFTTFYVAHCRSEDENNDPATSIPYHPLWQRCQWAGCVLVQDHAFTPVRTALCENAECAAGPTITGVSPNSGPWGGGTPITITGVGFTTGMAVLFGRNLAPSYEVISSTQINAVTPAGIPAQVVDITIVGEECSSPISLLDQFTYTGTGAPEVPVITSVGPTCVIEGTGVSLKGSGFTNAVDVYFGTTEVSFTVVSDSIINTTAPAGYPGLVEDITVVLSNGARSATTPADQVTYMGTPYINAISTNTGPAAGGTEVGIHGSFLTCLISVTFGGIPATTIGGSGFYPIMAFAPPHAPGTVDIVVTNIAGSSPIVVQDQFTYT